MDDKELLVLIRQKNSAYKKFKKKNSISLHVNFKNIMRIVRQKIKDVKEQYYRQELSTATIQSKWKIMNKLMNKPSIRTNIDECTIKGQSTSNNQKIVDALNCHFASFTTENNAHLNKNDYKFLRTSPSNSLLISEISVENVKNCLSSLKPKMVKSGNHDIPLKIWKEISNVIAVPLTTIVNKSYASGIFPSLLKHAKIVPVYKSGDKKDVRNYRPISILHNLSKVFEKIFLAKLVSFLSKFDLLSNVQFGFRKRHSTKDAILKALCIIDDIKKNKNIPVVVFVDLSKAFDCVSHTLLIQKLYHLGIRGIPLKWITSFISHRTSETILDEKYSTTSEITRGVPQGGILSPLLYTLFINDFESNVPYSHVVYADDTTIVSEVNNFHEIQNRLNDIHCYLDKYFKNNQLQMNVNKTQLLIISNKHKDTVSYQFGSAKISCTENAKFLGIYMDKKLNFNRHATSVLSKICQIVPCAYYIRKYLPLDCKFSFYYAFCYSHIMYSLPFISLAKKSIIKKIYIMQKKILKILLDIPYLTPTKLLFSKHTNILSFPSLIKISLSLTAYNIYFSNSPEAIILHFPKSFSSRMLNMQVISDPGSLRYEIVTSWNDLSVSLREKSSINLFKSSLTILLFNEDT